jgi:hypothetical protein
LLNRELHSRVSLGEALNNPHQKSSGNRFRATDAKLSGGWVRQELDLSHALSEFVECRFGVFVQRGPEHRKVDSPAAPIKQSRTKGMLQIGDHLRYRGLRDAELCGCFGHAAVLRDREEHTQVPQPQAPTNVVVQVGYLCHKP